MSGYGLEPRSIAVVIGPAIEQDCYQVGPEVADRFDPAVKMPEAAANGGWT